LTRARKTNEFHAKSQVPKFMTKCQEIEKDRVGRESNWGEREIERERRLCPDKCSTLDVDLEALKFGNKTLGNYWPRLEVVR